MADESQFNLGDLAVPFALGAASLAGGFGAGRNPGVDNPGATYLQMMQIPSLYEGMLQKRALAKHQEDMALYYQNLYTHQQNQDVQARQNNAVTATKTAVELGNVDAVLAAKDQLGTAFPAVFETAKARNAMLAKRGYVPLWQGEQAAPVQGGAVSPVEGLPAASQLGPANAPPQAPTATSPDGLPPYRQEQSESFSMGGLTDTKKTPASGNDELVTWFMNRYPKVPSPANLRADLASINSRLAASGRPTIAWDKNAQDVYMQRLQQEQPELYTRFKMTEQAASVPPQVAARVQTQGEQAPPDLLGAYQGQSNWEREQAALKEGTLGQVKGQTERKFARLPETEVKTLREQDDVLRTAAAIMDLAPRIIQKYGGRPGFMQRNLTAINQELGTQDPELARFIRLNGLLYTAARNRISGTAVGKNEERALNTYITDPTSNPVTVMQGVQEIFRTGLIEQGRNLQRAKSYGGEDLSNYAYHQIVKNRAAGKPLFPELSMQDQIGGSGDVMQPNLRYNPATDKIEPVAR